MPQTTSHEPAQTTPVKTADKKGGKAGAGAVMDDAPLFAGLDDFVLIQGEKRKKGAPKEAKPEKKAKTGETGPAPSGEPLPQKAPKSPKTLSPDPNALLLSVAEMCALLKISRATLIRMDKAGKLPGRIKLGGSVRYHRETIEAWLRNLITAPSA